MEQQDFLDNISIIKRGLFSDKSVKERNEEKLSQFSSLREFDLGDVNKLKSYGYDNVSEEKYIQTRFLQIFDKDLKEIENRAFIKYITDGEKEFMNMYLIYLTIPSFSKKNMGIECLDMKDAFLCNPSSQRIIYIMENLRLFLCDKYVAYFMEKSGIMDNGADSIKECSKYLYPQNGYFPWSITTEKCMVCGKPCTTKCEKCGCVYLCSEICATICEPIHKHHCSLPSVLLCSMCGLEFAYYKCPGCPMSICGKRCLPEFADKHIDRGQCKIFCNYPQNNNIICTINNLM